MGLTDEIAAHVLGEIHTMTAKIDNQNVMINSTADVVRGAADLIKNNSELAVKNARVATKLAQQESLAIFEQDMTKAVALTLNTVASAVATKSAAQWVVGGVVLAGLLAVLAFWSGYSRGNDAGSSFGYAQARSEIAAAAWGNTPDGKLAYQLAKAGSLEYLALCNRPGWKKVDNVCFGYTFKNETTYGWHVP